MKLVFYFALMTMAFPVMAKVLNYKPLSLQVEKGDRLEITGFQGNIKAVTVPNSRVVTVQLRQVNPETVAPGLKETVDEWLFSMQKQGAVIQVHVRSPQSKAAWSQLLAQSGSQPQFEMTVQMPSLPVEVSWRGGALSFQGLREELKIYAHSAMVSVSDHEAPLQINHQKGTIQLKKIKGDVDLDTYSGSVKGSDIQGLFKLKNFNGSSNLSGVNGQVDFVTYGGMLKVTEGKGKVEYDNEKGKVVLDKFEGSVRGVAEQGSLSATLKGRSNVRVTSKEGAVSLRMLNSSASVNAGSKEGHLNTPQFLRLTRLPNLRVVKGRLRGKNPGQIYVRTESGSIRIR